MKRIRIRNHGRILKVFGSLLFLSLCTLRLVAESSRPDVYKDVIMMRQLVREEPEKRKEALTYLDEHWRDSFVPMILEVLSLTPASAIEQRLYKLLKTKTDQKWGRNLDEWFEWWWSEDRKLHLFYPAFKALIYMPIDSKFADYFLSKYPAKIRLDEVRWGGVPQDGIPPLRFPSMISAEEARYLRDSNIVFGLEVNGDARAYPKRILAWHEMFVDEVGGVPVTGVYCTLCGSMILYKSVHDGVHYKLGTSGFLYRSNKLMYDKETQSLWNTIWGKPVIGSLAEKDIELERLSIVTTTWGAWRGRHPDTQVLALKTGHKKDYSEGAAYRDYFATDALMFPVPKLDRSLRNKDEVLSLIFSEYPDEPVAISVRFLRKNRIYHDRVGNLNFVVLTDKSAASRVFRADGHRFSRWDLDRSVTDEEGASWTLHEDRLESSDGRTLSRLPSHRTFWFGWYSAHEKTRLVK